MLSIFKIDSNIQLNCFDAYNRLKWQDSFHNSLTTEGASYMLGRAFTPLTLRTEYYMGLLLSGATPGASSVLPVKGGTELVASGYNRIQTYPHVVNAQCSWDMVSWTATGVNGWSEISTMFFATSLDDTGLMLSYAALQRPRKLVLGDVLQATYVMAQG